MRSVLTGLYLAMKIRPKILLLCDRRGWAFDCVARNIATKLSIDFYFEIVYVIDQPVLNESEYDLFWILWWGERYHKKFAIPKHKIVKEVSSHRWQLEAAYGRHSPSEAFERYLSDAGHVVATSLRLKELFKASCPNIYHYSLGVDTQLFRPLVNKSDSVAFGWAGNIADKTKGVEDILLPASVDLIDLKIAPGNLSSTQMVDFYNGLDVICVASQGEGTPLPLIEAMACACFPISVDVGVARELIIHGQNGLLVEREPEAFREAFNWCRANPGLVKAAGLSNAELVRNCRSLDNMSSQFSCIVKSILETNRRVPLGSPGNTHSFHRPATMQPIPVEHIKALLPLDKNSRIVVTSCSSRDLLISLVDMGYQRVVCLDSCLGCMTSLLGTLGSVVEHLEVIQPQEYLAQQLSSIDCIIITDASAFLADEIATLLQKVCSALKVGGRLIACFDKESAENLDAESNLQSFLASCSELSPRQLSSVRFSLNGRIFVKRGILGSLLSLMSGLAKRTSNAKHKKLNGSCLILYADKQ